MNILIIAAHPDDEVLGCGGTMARLAIEGNDVYTLILGEGITSRDEKRDRIKCQEELSELKDHIMKASNVLGVKNMFTYDYPDNRFDTVALLDIVKTVEKVKSDVKPKVVFTHHYGDLNIDHQIAFKAVMTAFRPIRGESVEKIYSFEVPSSTEWNTPSSSTYFMPNCFIDISKTIKHKIRAMKEYKYEIKDYPHPRSIESIGMKAKHRGVQVGIEAAEAFEIVRQINRI